MTLSNSFKAGVMGWPIGHSLSPRLHAFWLSQYGIDGSYEALAVEPIKLAATLHGLAANGFSGVNLTIPHKIAAMKIVDILTPTATRIGAVNLVSVEGGQLVGDNTDAYGFAKNVESAGFRHRGGAAFVLGAGGASHAVIVALQDLGFAEIRLANRSKNHADEVARLLTTPECRIEVVGWDKAAGMLSGIELLVNTTSLGMVGQPELRFPLDALPESACVCDIVYRPLETALLRDAKARGHRIVDGLGMLLHQARPSFKAFFKHDPEVTPELRAHVLEGIKA